MTQEHPTKTLAVLAAASLIIGVFFFEQEMRLFVFASLALLSLAIIENPLSRLVARGWMGFGHMVGAVNSRIILGIVFFLILTPISFLYRLFHAQQIQQFRFPKMSTTFKDTSHQYDQRFFEKPW